MNEISPYELKTMIADYMETGFLENIIDMFKHDKNLYPLIAELITDERVGVRLGTTALVETLKIKDPDYLFKITPQMLCLLKHASPVVRGDAAYLLGIIGHEDAITSLKTAAYEDDNADVRVIAGESIEDILKKSV